MVGKRGFQPYSGPGQPNPNLPAPPNAYPPLPNGPPPPQPSSNPTVNQPSNNTPNVQPFQHQAPQQTFGYNAQFGQFPGYPPHQPAAVGYPTNTYNQQPMSSQQQQQPAQQQQPQHPQPHPAYANYGYGAPAGPQQPPKSVQPYHQYAPPNGNQLPQNPNPGIPPNPYTGFPPGQLNGPPAHNAAGTGSQPPNKRPRYENNITGAAQQNPFPGPTPQINHNHNAPAVPPMRNNANNTNNKMNHAPSGSMRIGATTPNSRGGYSGGRPARSGNTPFGNNSPIRLNLGSAGGNSNFDNGSAPHYDSNHPHPGQPMAHPLPPYQPNHNPHFAQPTLNNNDYPTFPGNAMYPPSGNGDLANSAMGGRNGFAHDFNPGPYRFNSATPSTPGLPFRLTAGSPPNTGSTRSGRGGFRGGHTGSSMPRSSRERMSEFGGSESMTPTPRGNRPYPNMSFGSANRSERHGSSSRLGRSGNGPSGGRNDDTNSNYGGAGGPSRNGDRSGGPSNRGRSISNLPGSSFHRGGQNDRRGGGSNRGGAGPDRNSANRGGRKPNSQNSKFEDRKNHRTGRGGGASGSGPARQNPGPAVTRIKNGWGSAFREFNQVEKVKGETKKDESEKNKRNLTDFRIVGLEIPELSWFWYADHSDDVTIKAGPSGTGPVAGPSGTAPVAGPSGTAHDHEETQNGTNDQHGPNDNPAENETDQGPPDDAATNSVSADFDPAETARDPSNYDPSAATGFDLTAIDEHGSDHDENQEITDQLLPQSNCVNSETQPENIADESENATQALPADDASSEPRKDPIPPVIIVDSSDTQSTAAAQPPNPTSNVPATVPGNHTNPSTHSAIEVGGDSNRLRIYFSVAGTESTTVAPPTALPVKPAVPSALGKRKLSMSGASTSANVDDGLGDAAARGSSSGPPAIEDHKPEAGSSADPVPGSSTAPEASGSNLPAATPDIVEIPRPETAMEVESAVTDAKPELATDESGPATEQPETVHGGEDAMATDATDVDSKDAHETTQAGVQDDYPAPLPQVDRITITYANDTRRLSIDADVIQSLEIFRAERRVEISVSLVPAILQGGSHGGSVDIFRIFKGFLVEGLDPETNDYVVIGHSDLRAPQDAQEGVRSKGKGKAKEETDDDSKPDSNGKGRADGDVKSDVKGKGKAVEPAPADEEESADFDPLIPPFHELYEGPAAGEGSSSEAAQSTEPKLKQGSLLIIVRLETVAALSEIKWVRTGDVNSYISSLMGKIFHPDDEVDCGWRHKISVHDPDPVPSIQHLLDTWITTSSVGTVDSRIRFVDRVIKKDVEKILEILLRIIRSGNCNSTWHIAPTTPVGQHAADLRAPYWEQQTQVSLAVLCFFRLIIETAIEGGLPLDQVIKKATDIIRTLPYRLAFSALDSIYHDEAPL
ncbi:hypothetical protein PSTG_00697 [Puccinia striiformis f. sp. tritici PST-78]|uniref:Uncharacterized protein n=1 Tax=Puccinia striiformis f. sp. tritici PST-78 TaxID=1165861 RepID=A0A0L0W3R4_9BASI|nr:hypothetical protein PSTG_00697 [Puccinia striiformis f. sp. tritici PST-78]